MKKILTIMSLILLVAAMSVTAVKPVKDECTTIQSGELFSSSGDVITIGYNDFGYNYQAHLYNGDYGYPGWNLVMKWSDAWLSNKDCDGDGTLDRHLGYDTYIGSGAWLTNHWTTEYVLDDVICYYEYFIKIIAVPEGSELVDGVWYNAEDVRIGVDIWGQFAIIQESVYDSCNPEASYAEHERMPGLGNW